jgi:stage II sporulation protein D
MHSRHLRTTAGLTAVLVASSLVLAAPPAQSAALHVPDHATLKVSGRGFGHGHGMSQYGAQGAARKGLSGAQIVAFYYPHTRSGHAGGKVKVLVSADTDNNTTVLTAPGLTVLDLGDGSSARVPTTGAIGKATRWRLSSGSSGRTKVSYLTGAWHVWRTLAGDGEFRASKALTLVVGSGHVTYRGVLQSRTPVGGPATRRITVDKVSLEAYVQGVIPREMPASWLPAALRAQAIAARSYAAFEARSSTNPRFQLYDDTRSQVYGGKSAEVSTTNQATARTKGQVRTFHGAPAFTQFSASNGGWMSDGGHPYLVAKKDRFDPWSGNPYRSWTTKVTAGAIENAYPGVGNLTSISVTERDGHGLWNGRVVSMKLVGSGGTVTPSGDDFRSRLGLRSTWFALSIA